MLFMTEQELLVIQERCDKATKGPGVSYVEGRDHGCGSNFIMTDAEDIELLGATVVDQDFILMLGKIFQNYCKKLNA